jgi:hypothetical protein
MLVVFLFFSPFFFFSFPDKDGIGLLYEGKRVGPRLDINFCDLENSKGVQLTRSFVVLGEAVGNETRLLRTLCTLFSPGVFLYF